MRLSIILAAALTAAAPWALAQTAQPAASAAKKELVQKILQQQQQAVENIARQLVEAPAAQLLQQAGPALQQRVAADKREATAREIQGDVRKYVEEALPLVRDRALKLAPTTIGPVLEERLSEDELRQVLQVMQQQDTPAFRKFLSLGPELDRALGEKLVSETRSQVEPKMQALQSSVARRLGIQPGNKPATPGAGGASAPASAAKGK